MKILIVYSGGDLFQSIARKLECNIGTKFDVNVVEEINKANALAVLWDRTRRAGVFKGMDQFIFKVIDILFLRKSVLKLARSQTCLQQTQKIDPMNSVSTQKFLREQNFDLVVCIATSIINKQTLSIPRIGMINIHPGILPAYRGIGNFWAVQRRDFSEVGSCVHWMTSKIDVGQVLFNLRYTERYRSVWELNYNSMLLAAEKLGKIINRNTVLDVKEEIKYSTSNYYTWNGIFDYLKVKYIIWGKK